jgi:hypothetical protein
MANMTQPQFAKPNYRILLSWPFYWFLGGYLVGAIVGLFDYDILWKMRNVLYYDVLGIVPPDDALILRSFRSPISIWEKYPLTGGVLGFFAAIIHIGKTAIIHERNEREKKLAHERNEREKKLARERAQSLYASNYIEYLPKWRAWREAFNAYEAEKKSYDAWRVKFHQAWEDYRAQGIKAAELFENIHANVEKRGRLELELSAPEHLAALFREAIGEAAKVHPGLGVLGLVGPKISAKEPPPRGGQYSPLTPEELQEYDWQVFPVIEGGRVNHRQVNPTISHNMPELAYLLDDPRLEAVRDVLPPMPAIGKVVHEYRTPPKKPVRPTPPENLLFYSADGETAAPVPPNKVTWS